MKFSSLDIVSLGIILAGYFFSQVFVFLDLPCIFICGLFYPLLKKKAILFFCGLTILMNFKLLQLIPMIDVLISNNLKNLLNFWVNGEEYALFLLNSSILILGINIMILSIFGYGYAVSKIVFKRIPI